MCSERGLSSLLVGNWSTTPPTTSADLPVIAHFGSVKVVRILRTRRIILPVRRKCAGEHAASCSMFAPSGGIPKEAQRVVNENGHSVSSLIVLQSCPTSVRHFIDHTSGKPKCENIMRSVACARSLTGFAIDSLTENASVNVLPPMRRLAGISGIMDLLV